MHILLALNKKAHVLLLVNDESLQAINGVMFNDRLGHTNSLIPVLGNAHSTWEI